MLKFKNEFEFQRESKNDTVIAGADRSVFLEEIYSSIFDTSIVEDCVIYDPAYERFKRKIKNGKCGFRNKIGTQRIPNTNQFTQ